MSEKDLKGKYSGSITGDVTLTNSTPSANGELGYDPAQGFLGYHNGAVGPIGGGDTSMEIVDNDSNADGTVILKAGSRWLNGRVATNASDITTAAPSSGSDDTIRDLDGSTGLRAETGVTIRNYVYWDMINDKYVTISNASDSAKQAYDSTSRTINTTEYAPIGYVDVAESGGAHTLTVENYPNQSWDSYKELLSDTTDWQQFVPTVDSGTLASTSIVLWRRVGSMMEIQAFLIWSVAGTSTGEQILNVIPSGYTIDYNKLARYVGQGSTNQIVGNGYYYSGSVLSESGVTVGGNGIKIFKNGTSIAYKGNEFFVNSQANFIASIPILEWQSNSTIVTPATEFDWRSANLVQKTTGVDITSSDPIGTFVAYKWDASNNRTIDTTTLTQSIDDIKANGFRIYARSRNAASTAGLPPQIQIKVAEAGAGIGSFHVDGYGSTSFSNALNYSRFTGSAAPAIGFGTGVFFSKDSGTIVLDAGNKLDTETGTARVGYSAADVSYTNGYFTVKASATTPLVGLPKTFYYTRQSGTVTGLSNAAWTDVGLPLYLPAGRYEITIGGITRCLFSSVPNYGNGSFLLSDVPSTYSAVLVGGTAVGIARSTVSILDNTITYSKEVDWAGGNVYLYGYLNISGGTVTDRNISLGFIKATKLD